MHCSKCGAMNDDKALNCHQCGTTLQGEPGLQEKVRVEISNHLVPAILVTIFCCLPFGIPAIVFAAQVNGKIASGDIEGAMESSRKAKTWCWVSFIAGLVTGGIMAALNFIR